LYFISSTFKKNNMEKDNSASNNESNSRRKLIAGIGLLSLLAPLASAAKVPFIRKKFKETTKPAPNKVKMLTQDGKLVEVDERFLSTVRQNVTNDDLKSWIKK
jgi:hypothetical protein